MHLYLRSIYHMIFDMRSLSAHFHIPNLLTCDTTYLGHDMLNLKIQNQTNKNVNMLISILVIRPDSLKYIYNYQYVASTLRGFWKVHQVSKFESKDIFLHSIEQKLRQQSKSSNQNSFQFNSVNYQ